MSKNKPNKPEVNNATENKPVEVAAEAEVETSAPETTATNAPPPATATELATVASADLATVGEELVDDGVTVLHLVKLLPHKAKAFKRLHVASEAEFERARDALSEAARERFDDLQERMTPEADRKSVV